MRILREGLIVILPGQRVLITGFHVEGNAKDLQEEVARRLLEIGERLALDIADVQIDDEKVRVN